MRKGAISLAMPYGDDLVEVSLPERTRVLKPPPPLPPAQDPEGAVKNALAAPIAHEPLSKLVGPGAKVTIVFDDPAGPTYPKKEGWRDFREIAITILLEELERRGVSRRDVRLLCANALHRQWTTAELATILGPRIAYGFGARLSCHDAEDKEAIVHLGETERGFELELSRAVFDCDQFIYVGLPKTLFNGGWKALCVGLSTYRSIRYHHRPWPFARGHSVEDPQRSSFHKLMAELGAMVEKELAKKGRRVFHVEGVVNNRQPPEVVAAFAGHTTEVHDETVKVMQAQLAFPVEGQCDVLIYGLANAMDGYSKFAKINPILAAHLGVNNGFGRFQNKPLVREGGILILHHPFTLQFDDIRHPSYRELYQRVLDVTQDANEAWELFAEDFAHRPEYIHKYRYGYGYHGAHPFFMWGRMPFPKKYLSHILVAGAQDFEVVRRLGLEPFATLEDAIGEAENILGRGCALTYHQIPPTSVPRVL